MTTTQINRIRILETINDERIRCFALTRRLSEINLNGMHSYTLKNVESLNAEKGDFLASRSIAKAVAEILGIQGIESVEVMVSDVFIKIHRAYDWKDVQELVLHHLKLHIYEATKVEVQDWTEESQRTGLSVKLGSQQELRA